MHAIGKHSIFEAPKPTENGCILTEENLFVIVILRYISFISLLFIVPTVTSAQFVPEIDSILNARQEMRYEPENNLPFIQFELKLYEKYGSVKMREQISAVLISTKVSTANQILFAAMLEPVILDGGKYTDSLITHYVYLLKSAYSRSHDKCEALTLLSTASGLYNIEKRHILAKEVYDYMWSELKVNKCGQALIPYYIGLSRSVYMPVGNHAKAAEIYLKALHTVDSLKGSHSPILPYYEYTVYMEIANLNYHIGNYQEAIRYWQKALVLIDLENKWTNHITGTYNNIGLAYRKLKQYDKAKEYLNTCIKRAIQTKDQAWIGIATGNIGSILAEEENYTEAIPLLLKDIQMSKVTMQYGSLTNAYEKVGFCYTGLNNLVKAEAYYDSAFQSVKRWPKPIAYGTYTYNSLLELFSNYAKLQFRLGNYQKAYLAQQQSVTYHDSLRNMRKKQEISLLNSYHTFDKQETENKLLKAKVRGQELRESVAIILTLLCAVLLLSAIIIYRQRLHRLRAETKALDASKQVELERSLRLEKELHVAEEINLLQQKQAEERLALRERELSSITVQIQQKNEVMLGLKTQLEKIAQKESTLQDDLKSLYKSVRSDLNISDDWEKFKVHFELVHPNFFTLINRQFPDISLSDLRICAYLRMNMDNASIAHVLNVSSDSLRVRRHRLRKRMGFESDKQIYNYLESL